MRIGIDAMGGDYAPTAVLEGLALLRERLSSDWRVVLFGPEKQLREELARMQGPWDYVEFVDAPTTIEMGDHPVRAIAEKRDSSIVRGFEALLEGRIDGFASAGNTGAMMAGTMTYVGLVPGLIRPSIATEVPVGDDKSSLLLDVGLNSDCKPDVLVQYGQLGAIYAELMLGIEHPRVGLLNIGSEPGKGNIVAKHTQELMANQDGYHYCGNVEGGDIFTGEKADVIVCDGFVGNVVLKECEGIYRILHSRGVHDGFAERLNPERYGGTPVLGVNHVVVIAHGSSNGRSVANMILQTSRAAESGLCDKIKKAFTHA